MPSEFRLAGILTVTLAVCGPARAQELAPPGSGVSIRKLAVDSGLAHTVKYFVKGGSPRLQALVRRVEWAENELSVVEQLQLLKLDTVVNDRRIAAFRTARLTNPHSPPGLIPFPVGPGGGDGGSPLQRSLTRQLTKEATPESALRLIGFLEHLQTDLEAELKALPPQEKKAAQGPVDALRPRLAALTRGDVAPPEPQPVLPPPAVQAVPQMPPTPPDPVAFKPIDAKWGQTWWPAEVLQVRGDETLIHYTGFAASWDEWVAKDRIRGADRGPGTQDAPGPDPVVPRQVTARRW
jgi:RNA binding activity-knot of a chromodomain